MKWLTWHWLGNLAPRFGLRLRRGRCGANSRVDPEKLRIRPAVEGLEVRLLPALPTVTAVSPNSEPASTSSGACKITGTNFTGVTNVYFGSVASSFYTVTSGTSITANVPSQSYGVVDVTVQNGSGTSSTSSADQYTYVLVTLTNPGTQTSTAGSSASLQLSATVEPGGTLSYSASNLPTGLSLNTSTGLISGTPTTTGNSVTARAYVAANEYSQQTFTWNVLRASTTTLSASPSSIVSGQTETLTVTVSHVSGGLGTPSGTVTFYDGSTDLGRTFAIPWSDRGRRGRGMGQRDREVRPA